MKKENVSEILSQIDEKYISEAAQFASENKGENLSPKTVILKGMDKQPRRFRWGVVAACIALFVVIGTTAFAFAAEAKEYNDAVTFFEENGLSTEGLTRTEVKAVYRDITEKRFTYGKTAEVIQHSVSGWEIQQAEPTPEQLAEYWYRNNNLNTVSDKGIDYRVVYQYSNDKRYDIAALDRSLFECYRDGEMLWSAEIRDYYILGYLLTGDGALLWGRNEILSFSDKSYGCIAFVDKEGNIKWHKAVNHGYENGEYIGEVMSNGDGTWAVISKGDGKYLCLSCFDADGNEISFHQTEIGNYGIHNAARLGDGYIVQLWNQVNGDTALLYKMDREGVLTDSFTYEGENCDYYITDMIEYNGQVYLSANAVPKSGEGIDRGEINGIIDYLYSRGRDLVEISSEELTPVVRDNYKAILLICDAEGGNPKTFYTVKGSMGGRLSVNTSGLLEWNVESFTSTYYSPATSSFSIGGMCAVYRYTFNGEGTLIGQLDTGDKVSFNK